KIGKILFERHLEHYKPEEYEFHTNVKGRKERVSFFVKRLDYTSTAICTRCQYFIGLIPFMGDAAKVYLDYQLVAKKAQQADIRGEEYTRLPTGEAVIAYGSSEVDSKGKGLTGDDQDQIKPGAGLAQGEIIQIPTEAVSTSAPHVPPGTQPAAKKRRLFGFLRLSGVRKHVQILRRHNDISDMFIDLYNSSRGQICKMETTYTAHYC
ncbi:hypothetical protein J132_07628, partial [Termitomyces sp. J132]